MGFNGFVLNIVFGVIVEVLVGVLLPEGRMKKFTLSVISVFLLYIIITPICQFLGYESINEYLNI